MPDNKDPLGQTIYGKDNWKKTRRSDLLKQYPGLEYVSGDWGNDTYKYKLPSGEYSYYAMSKTGVALNPYQFGSTNAPAATAPVVPVQQTPVVPTIKAPTMIKSPTFEQPNQGVKFGVSGYTDPKSGQTYSYDAKYKEKEIIPTTQSYKKGGLVGKMTAYKKYAEGGAVTPEEQAQIDAQKANNNQMIGSGIGIASQLGSMGGQYLAANSIQDDGTIGLGQATGAGALKGAGKGATMGLAFGPQGAAIGAGLGALVGAGSAYFGAKKNNEGIEAAQDKAKQDVLASEATAKYQSAMNKQMQEREAGYSHGGLVKGKGGPKEDAIKAKVEAGSFIVPAVNAKKAEVVKEVILKAPSVKKKANLNQKNGEDIKVSNGEYVFTEDEKDEIVEKAGHEMLEELAPEADEFKKGGMVDCYADGGDVQIDPKKEKERLEKERLANEKEAKYYKDFEKQTAIGLKKLEARKQFEKEAKYKKEVYDAAKKQYDEFSKKLEKDPLQIDGYQDAVRVGNPELKLKRKEELRKKQEQLLGALEKADNDYKNSDTKYKLSQKDDSFNPDGSFKEVKQNVSKAVIAPSMIKKEIPSKSGAEIEKITGKENISGTKTAPKITSSVKESLKFTPPTEDDSDITPPKTIVPKEKEKEYESVLSQTAQKAEKDFAEQKLASQNKDSQRQQNISKGLGLVGSQLQGLGNYALPYQQYKMGQRFLAETGKRPKGQIDPDFQNSVNQAQVNAQFGFTPEEQALLDSKNLNALRAGQGAAQNFSGGSSSTAYNMTRDAANQYYGRGLSSALANKNLEMQKKLYADQLVGQKADMNRQLFSDNLTAWKEQQAAGGSLVGAGLSNAIGAQRLNQEMQFQNQYSQNNNPWKNYNI